MSVDIDYTIVKHIVNTITNKDYESVWLDVKGNLINFSLMQTLSFYLHYFLSY